MGFYILYLNYSYFMCITFCFASFFVMKFDTNLMLFPALLFSLPLFCRVSIEVVKKGLEEELSLAKNKQGIVKKEIKEVIMIIF